MNKINNSLKHSVYINLESILPGYKRYLILFIIVLFFISLPAFSMTGNWPRCTGQCTANDIAGVSIHMNQQGGTFQIHSDIAFTSSATRYNLHMVYDLYENNNIILKDAVVCLNGNGCVTPDPTTNIAYDILVGTYTYFPGRSYSLRNTLFFYDSSSPSCTCKSGSCSPFPPAKCKIIADTISICPSPIIQLTSLQSICLGGSVPLNASASPAGGSYRYSWSPATGLSSTVISNPVASPTMSTNYTVTVTNTDCGSTANAYVFVLVRNPPTASFLASPLSGCPPLAVAFMDSSTAPPDSTIIKWEWDFENDGIFDKIASSPVLFIHSYAGPGLYSVRLRVTTDKGCMSSIVKSGLISVNQAPVCTIAAHAICAGTTGTASVPAFAGATYAWTIGSNDSNQYARILSGQGTGSITWTGSIGGTVSLGVTVTGPQPMRCSCLGSAYIPVQGRPTALAGTYGPICSNETLSLAGRATDFASSWWSITNGTGSLIAGSSPGIATFYPVYDSSKVYAKTILTYYASAVPPCSGLASNNTTITVYQTPEVSILISY